VLGLAAEFRAIGFGGLERFHDLELGVLQVADPAPEVGHLVHQTGQRLGIADRAVGDPLLVTDEPLAYRLQIRLGFCLIVLQIEDPGVGGDQFGGELGPLGLVAGQVGVLGQGATAMLELGDRAVDGLQIQQSELDSRVGLDVSSPCRRWDGLRCVPPDGPPPRSSPY